LKSQIVLSCIDGSPAARAGIHQGDELIEINGTDHVYLFFFLIMKLLASSFLQFIIENHYDFFKGGRVCMVNTE